MRTFTTVRSLRALVPAGVLMAIACGGTPPSGDDDGKGTTPVNNAKVDGGGGGGSATSGSGGSLDLGDSGTPQLTPDSGCATGSGEARRKPVHMMLVVDRSGSMKGVKWTAQSAALTSVIEQLGREADPTLAVGLDFFGDAGTTDSTVEEPLSAMDGAKATRLAGLVTAAQPNSGTPTFDALTLAYNAITAYRPTGVLADGSKVVVLLSDGVPTASLSHLGNPKPERQWIYELVANASSHQMRTFSLGVGKFPGDSDYDPGFMGHVAVHGQTRRTPTCNPDEKTNEANVCHFQVTPPASGSPSPAETAALTKAFTDALTAIRGQVGTCDFALNFAPGATVDFTKVNVVFTDANGKQTIVSKDAVNGWSYDNDGKPTAVHLSGAACQQVQSTSGKVTIVLGCDPGKIY